MIVSFFFYLRPWGPKKESNILHKMFGKWAERKLQKSSWWQSKNTLVKCARISVVYWFSLIGCQERKCYIFLISCLDDSVVTQNTNYFNYIMTIRDSVTPFICGGSGLVTQAMVNPERHNLIGVFSWGHRCLVRCHSAALL